MTRAKQLPFRPRASVLALEPRVLFDGAAAVATVDHLADAPAHAEAAKDTAPTPVALYSPRSGDHGKEGQGPAQEAAAGITGTGEGITTLLVVDARVADYASLLADLPTTTAVIVVDAGESGLEAVGKGLAKLHNVESVQILSHGTPGGFTLGRDSVSYASLQAHGAQLQGWAPHLTADADILLYGCDIGQGTQGQALIKQIAALTGADVAASTDATGAAALGGNWEL